MAGRGILCPACGSMRQQVVDSRPARETIRRRRVCLNRKCGIRFTTYEYVYGQVPGCTGCAAREKRLEAIREAIGVQAEAAEGLAAEEPAP